MEQVGGSAERGAEFGRDWTKGSIARNLLSLSWPVIISQSLGMMGLTIDMIWVGKLGAVSIAGVGVASAVVMMMMPIIQGLTMGVRAMVARFVGAGDARGANHAARQAFIISAVLGAVMATIGIFLTEPILTLMGVESEVVAEGAIYTRIMFLGAVAISSRVMADSIMQTSGDTVTPMIIAIIFVVFHMALCPSLVLGWWIFPCLGVRGAAISNVISQSLGLALGLWVLFTGRTRLRLALSNFRLDLNIIWRMVRIGIPASIMGMQRSLGQLIMMRFMVFFGTLAVAGHTIWQRVEVTMVVLNIGLGIGAGVLVGQNLGAGKPERAERSGWLALGFSECIMVLCSGAVLLWAENVVSIFNTEPALVEVASSFLRIAAIGWFVLGSIVFMSCLSGAGDTVPPMLFELALMWLVMIPLAFFLPRVTDLGMYGVRWAMVAGMFVGAVAYITYFRLGRWKRKRV
ncbi:MATE family efflux transporter [Chloroflexota bacterium]